MCKSAEFNSQFSLSEPEVLCDAFPSRLQVISALKASLNLSANTDALMSGARGVPALEVADLNPAHMNVANVSDAILGGMFMAARPCGPPNRLSSGSMEKVEAKYLESTYDPLPLPLPALL